ncbi:MAG: putative peptidoglycan glycosyltransferase FtsW [Patescibacteria group bacterium]
MAKKRAVDSYILFATLALVIGGFLIFLSASLGLLAREGAEFADIATSQLLLGIVGGLIALFVTSNIPYRFWKQYSFYIFILACVLCLLVFTPLGIELNGARSWLDFGFTTFQPAEALKIGYVLYLATWLSQRRKANIPFLVRIGPFVAITSVVALLLLLQPDMGTFLVIGSAGGAMFFASGARFKDMGILALAGVIALSGFIVTHPHALDRIQTFLDPAKDPQGAGYQIQKSLIAVGSGQVLGRGFGQSIQKFTTLPEPTSDSIFAVFAEEFGFVGSVVLVLGFLTFALRSLFIAARTPDLFSGLVVVGIAILISVQSFLNIGAMLAVFPLSGLPLIFISHGGSALAMALASVGIMLQISRYART